METKTLILSEEQRGSEEELQQGPQTAMFLQQ